ncbi:3-phosphoshikimate 1-carboxyvinyltransferase [Clostridiales bacterium PH28_bin88]|nr:3-phosphoshikimate 1-carboxyvinyltransferase [Clostridiales bacterium PH28_bin88]
MELRIEPAQGFKGEVNVPGDKSISHRAAMLGAMAEGTTEIRGFLRGADCLSTIRCLQQLGVEFRGVEDGPITVYGRELDGLQEPAGVLDCGNSGTTMRLLLGMLAGLRGYAVLAGDASLQRRPMGRVVKPLREMGAAIWGRQGGTLAPLSVQWGNPRPIHYRSPVASAQAKSAVLLAGLHSPGKTSVTEPSSSRDHTERMLEAFGAKVHIENLTVSVAGQTPLTGRKVEVPGDISSAAFFLVAGSIVPGAEILLKGVGVNPTRTGILEVLRSMGADIQLLEQREAAGEPVADLLVKHQPLRGVTVGGDMIPRLIDEVPALAVAAAAAQGTTVIRDATELRVKESDRISAIVRELSRMGADVEELPDGLVIQGGRQLKGATCCSYDDHRMAMALAVAGLVARGETRISDAECIRVSFPDFPQVLTELQR